MVTHNGLMRIFWPSDAPTSPTPGVLVGFRNSQHDVLVVSILQDVGREGVDNALRDGTLLHHKHHDVYELLKRCHHSSMRVLGLINPSQGPGHVDSHTLIIYTDPRTRMPRLHCPIEVQTAVQIISYHRPNPIRMQFLSLHPIMLSLGDVVDESQWDIPFKGTEEADEQERQRKDGLVQKLRLHTVIAHQSTQEELSLSMLLDQANCSYELDAVLQKNIGGLARRGERVLSMSERMTDSAATLYGHVYYAIAWLWGLWVRPIFTHASIVILIAQRLVSEIILRLLEWHSGSPSSHALKDISATAQQIDLRLQQFCYWPIQYMTLQQRRSDWGSKTKNHPDYIRFYNSLWLVANDVIIGIALGTFIIENSQFVAVQLDTIFNLWSLGGLRSMIIWLMEWPGGLKLNTELAKFLGDLFLWVIDHWAECISVMREHLPKLVQLLGLSAFLGATLPISLVSDLASLLTMHIHAFYIASARMFNWQLAILISLFHLFRGKKRNVLRNRIDSCDYDLDQLLLGTILFTLLFFLLPTVLVFYLTFASARLSVIFLKAALEMGLACLNHFPLFALMLRVKDPNRLPGGICFELQDPGFTAAQCRESAASAPTSYIVLKSLPLSLRAIFHSYFELGSRVRKHYLSPSVLICLASGQLVPSIRRRNLYSLQYSMLPATRVGIPDLWARLVEKDSSSGRNMRGHFSGIQRDDRKQR